MIPAAQGAANGALATVLFQNLEYVYYIYIYIYIYTYIYIYNYNYNYNYIRLPSLLGMESQLCYGHFSEFQMCFCGLDPGNLKSETVRAHKRHVCF